MGELLNTPKNVHFFAPPGPPRGRAGPGSWAASPGALPGAARGAPPGGSGEGPGTALLGGSKSAPPGPGRSGPRGGRRGAPDLPQDLAVPGSAGGSGARPGGDPPPTGSRATLSDRYRSVMVRASARCLDLPSRSAIQKGRLPRIIALSVGHVSGFLVKPSPLDVLRRRPNLGCFSVGYFQSASCNQQDQLAGGPAHPSYVAKG